MKTKKLTSEFQASYEAMIDSVEEFVVKEGKTIQQAFYAAEEKLDDATEMSKEKIQHASSYLKDNLRLLSETAEDGSEAYKEQIKFDLAYVKDSLWGKLHSIANSNTADLIEFTTTLKEKAQTVITEEHLATHQEHLQWGYEYALWQDEVKFWKKDHDKALTKLVAVEKALKHQLKSQIKHTKLIKSHAEINHEHEKMMSSVEQDLSSDVFKVADEKQIAVHQQERQIHAQHLKLHHVLKTQHFKIMAMINRLNKEIHKA